MLVRSRLALYLLPGRILDAGLTAQPVGTAEGRERCQLFTIDDLRRR